MDSIEAQLSPEARPFVFRIIPSCAVFYLTHNFGRARVFLYHESSSIRVFHIIRSRSIYETPSGKKYIVYEVHMYSQNKMKLLCIYYLSVTLQNVSVRFIFTPQRKMYDPRALHKGIFCCIWRSVFSARNLVV